MKTTHVILVLIIIFSCLISYSTLTTEHHWGGDFSLYIMQARSILEGSMQSIVDQNTFSMTESSRAQGPITYPWGFPLLLAPVLHIFDLNLIALKTVNILCFGFFLICLFILFSKYLSARETLLVIALFAFNPLFIWSRNNFNNIVSDFPFLFFSTLSILLIDRFILSNPKSTVSIPKYIFLGIAIFYAYFTRTNGILLLPVLLICQVIQTSSAVRKIKISLGKALALNSVPYLIFFALLIFTSLIFPSGTTSYSLQLKYLSLQSLITNIHIYFELPSALFWGVPFHSIIYYATLPFVLVGLLLNLRKKYHFIVYSALTLLLYIVWPWSIAGPRFIFPILPFYIYFAFTGMKWSLGYSKRFSKLGHALTITFWCVIIAFCLKSSLISAKTNLDKNRETRWGPFNQASMEMFDFVSKHTETNSIIVFFKPRVLRMMTGRNSIMIDSGSDLHKGDYYVFFRSGYYNQVNFFNHVYFDLVNNSGPVIELQSKFDNEQFTVYHINTSQAQKSTVSSIVLPPGFSASSFYRDVPNPIDFTFRNDGNLLVVNQKDPKGVFLAKKGDTFDIGDAYSTTGAPFDNPIYILQHPDRTVFVTNALLLKLTYAFFEKNIIFKIPAGGSKPTAFVTPENVGRKWRFKPCGITIAPPTFRGPNVEPGDLIVASFRRAVWAINPSTGAAQIIAEGEVFINNPVTVVFNPDGRLFVCEEDAVGNSRIVCLGADGTVTPFLSDVPAPRGLAFNPVTGDIYFVLKDKSGEIWWIPSEGGDSRVFASGLTGSQIIKVLKFSPDGQSLFATVLNEVIEITGPFLEPMPPTKPAMGSISEKP